MMRSILLLTLLSASVAQAADAVDAGAARKLYDKSCMACHAAKFGGDGSSVFTRPDHKVHDLKQLQARVTGCSMKTNAGWFPSDEATVATWLNQTYYKFK